MRELREELERKLQAGLQEFPSHDSTEALQARQHLFVRHSLLKEILFFRQSRRKYCGPFDDKNRCQSCLKTTGCRCVNRMTRQHMATEVHEKVLE